MLCWFGSCIQLGPHMTRAGLWIDGMGGAVTDNRTLESLKTGLSFLTSESTSMHRGTWDDTSVATKNCRRRTPAYIRQCGESSWGVVKPRAEVSLSYVAAARGARQPRR